MTLILVILLVTLIPLGLVLVIAIYMFKRNKTNSVAAAMERRNSSVRREARLQDLDKEMEKEKEVNLFGALVDDDKKQNRTGMGFLPGIVPDDDEKKGKFAETLTDFMHQNSGLLYQVPDDKQLKQLLKGKTQAEKMALLKEVEKAKQAKLHMEYLLQKQQIKSN